MQYNEITSRKNSLIIETSKLADKKHRDKSGMFCADGYKLLEEAIKAKLNICRLFFTGDALQNYGELIEAVACEQKYLVSDEVFAKLTDEKAPQGILTCIEKPEVLFPTENELRDGGFIILDNVQNPLNLGAIIRCAYSLGADKIVLTKGCADPFGAKAVRAAMGALFKCRLFFSDNAWEAAHSLTNLGNRTLCTRLDDTALKLCGFEFLLSDSIVIGNEGHGVSDDTAKACTNSLYIPMNEGAESLNAATAAAITIWEMKKSQLL